IDTPLVNPTEIILTADNVDTNIYEIKLKLLNIAGALHKTGWPYRVFDENFDFDNRSVIEKDDQGMHKKVKRINSEPPSPCSPNPKRTKDGSKDTLDDLLE
ncbi:unnamed protein product, partial [Didymodactylos carnosus]